MSRERDPAAVVAFLRFGSVPAPLTIYRDALTRVGNAPERAFLRRRLAEVTAGATGEA